MPDERELFTGTAWYYAKYRLGYPREFFDFVVRYYGLDGKGRLLDLGCGTGQITIPLGRYFQEAIGLDPEREMLAEAQKEAQKAGVTNIKWVLKKAEEMSEALGYFRLTTMGGSFHWMEQEKVLEKIYDLTEQGGGLVIVSDSSSPWRSEGEEKWKDLQKQIVQRYLGEVRRTGNSYYVEPKERFEALLDRSPFRKFEVFTHDYIREWTIESVIGFLFSTSFASRRLFGARVREFEQELKDELLNLEPSGRFAEKVRVEALLARK